MKKTAARLVFVSCVLLVQITLLRAQGPDTASNTTKWPTHGWAKGTPASVGLDEKRLAELDSIFATRKAWPDAFAVFRCGTEVFERTYPRDFGAMYANEAKTRGPLNAHLTGWYNYFDPAWHPYFHGTDLHTMQSVTKTVSSVIMGIAITRGDFKADLDTPLLRYFDVPKVKNVDERKQHITLRHVLTMSTGLDWNEKAAYDDPQNDSSLMEAEKDWIQYVIDRPMAQEPGKVWNYSSGGSELLAFVFQQETGQDIARYGEKYLFTPLGMDYFWKRTPLGLPDTEGGLYLSITDLAKIGYLYLQDGMWDGKRIVSKEWIKQSLAPSMDATKVSKYGYQWWLSSRTDRQAYIWAALGFGGQRLIVFPEENLIAVSTGWQILKGEDYPILPILSNQLLSVVRTQSCNVPK